MLFPSAQHIGEQHIRALRSTAGSPKNKITIDKETITIVEGAGTSASIAGRVTQLRTQVEHTTSDNDREKLQERLAKLVGGVAI